MSSYYTNRAMCVSGQNVDSGTYVGEIDEYGKVKDAKFPVTCVLAMKRLRQLTDVPPLPTPAPEPIAVLTKPAPKWKPKTDRDGKTGYEPRIQRRASRAISE